MQPNPAQSAGSYNAILDKSQLPADGAAQRLRDRYIAARFLQFHDAIHGLRETDNVMRRARQLLDDEHPRLAAELLQLAIEEDRSQQPLWLCLIELAYLAGNPAAFAELSDAFRQRFPQSDSLPVIDALGNKLLPNDPRFVHANKPVSLPNWSIPESEHRNEAMQKKLHAALAEAMAQHAPR
jgi:hypothetical protein